jgi:hypothetical protein
MIAVVIDDTTRAELTAMSGERVTLLSDGAFAPGARIRVLLPDGAVLRIKVHNSSRQGERFVVVGRAFDLRRELREALAARLLGNGDDQSIG